MHIELLRRPGASVNHSHFIFVAYLESKNLSGVQHFIVQVLQSSSYSLTLHVQALSCRFAVTWSTRLRVLGHSSVPPSVPLGQRREIRCRRQLRLPADWLLLWEHPSLLVMTGRARGSAEREQIQGITAGYWTCCRARCQGSVWGVLVWELGGSNRRSCTEIGIVCAQSWMTSPLFMFGVPMLVAQRPMGWAESPLETLLIFCRAQED